jgi:hypothetical protein
MAPASFLQVADSLFLRLLLAQTVAFDLGFLLILRYNFHNGSGSVP